MNRVTFVSLGGLEEIGLNCYLYGNTINNHSNYIMVDLGIGFRDNKFAFVDTFAPDLSFLKMKNHSLDALIFTHGHEDHIGAFEYYWKDFKHCPIYATEFTVDLLLNKFKHYIKNYNPKELNIIKVEYYKKYSINDFAVTFFPIDHSIPDAAVVLIETHNKAILHSGDFKININKFCSDTFTKSLPKQIDYLFCESTNADKDKTPQTECTIVPDLTNIIKSAKGSIWVTLFSSNIERLNNLVTVATKYNKKIVLLGTSVNNYYHIAVKQGYIQSSNVISLNEVKKYSASELLYIITGSQGENNSFLLRVLQQGHNGLKISSKDTVVFLSKPIPGNELKVNKAYNLIVATGASLYRPGKYHLHVSGHAYSEQIKLFIKTINPKCVIPIHGEMLQLQEVSKIARSLNIASSIVKNGEIVDITKDTPKIVDLIPFNKIHFENGRAISFSDPVLQERKKLMYEGTVTIGLMIAKGAITPNIQINTVGLLTVTEKEEHLAVLRNKILLLNQEIEPIDMGNEELVTTKIRSLVKKYCRLNFHRHPIIIVTVFYR